MSTKKSVHEILLLSLLTTVALILFSGSFDAPFTFDDWPNIRDNYNIRVSKLNYESLRDAAFKSPAGNRPLPNIAFALNYYFRGYDVVGYHVVNILIHIVTGIFLFFLIKATVELSLGGYRKSDNGYRITEIGGRNDQKPLKPYPLSLNPQIVAFCATLLWIVHPLHTQSVTYIVQRMTSMAAMFYILSLLCYVKGRLSEKGTMRWIFFFGSLISGICALASKQIAATLPFFIFLYEWYFFQDLRTDWIKKRIGIIIGGIVFIGIMAILYVGTNPINWLLSGYQHRDFTLGQRVLTEFRVVILYISLLIFPHPSRLTLDYDFPLSYSLINPLTTLLSLLVIITLFVLAIYTARRHRLISFAILWFLGNLVIESSVIPLELVYEHRTYLPSMFIGLLFLLLVVRYVPQSLRSLRVPIKSGLGNLMRLLRFARNDDRGSLQNHWIRGYQWVNLFLLLIIVSLFSFWTYERNEVWSNELIFLEDAVKKAPNKARVHNNLGRYLAEKGDTDKAIAEFTTAITIRPSFPKALNNLGNALSELGRTDEAIDQYRKALILYPASFEAHNDLGNALMDKQMFDEALYHYSISTSINPKYSDAHYNLGTALTKKGRYEESIGHYSRALSLEPDFPEAYNNLGTALLATGKTKEAVYHFKEALRINPDLESAKYNLNIAMQLQKTVIESDKPDFYYKQGILYQKAGFLDMAVKNYRTALSLNPKHLGVLNNLAVIYTSKDQIEDAIKLFNKIIAMEPDNPVSYYNIACVYARQNKKDESLKWLEKSIDKGFHNWDLFKTDKDLENIRNTEYYKKLLMRHRGTK